MAKASFHVLRSPANAKEKKPLLAGKCGDRVEDQKRERKSVLVFIRVPFQIAWLSFHSFDGNLPPFEVSVQQICSLSLWYDSDGDAKIEPKKCQTFCTQLVQ